MEVKCPLKLPKILLDKDSKDLFTCVGKTNFSSVWECLGDQQCQHSLSCWSKPLQACAQDIWYTLTDDVERHRIERSVSCIRPCEKQHTDDFMQAAFCVLDTCSQDVLDCYHDEKCRNAAKCLPAAASQCSMATLESYVSQPLFRSAVKAVASGLKVCGRAAVEMLRDQNVADGIRCAAQCTRTPNATSSMTLVV